MFRLIDKEKKLREEQSKKLRYHPDVSLEGVVDNVEKQHTLNNKIAKINQSVDKIIKICEKREEEKKKHLEEEFEEMHKELKKELENSLKELEEICLKIKKANEEDYKGIYAEISSNLNALSVENKALTKELFKYKYKVSQLEESLQFIQKQIEDEEDLNTYLKLKLRLKDDPQYKAKFMKEVEESTKAGTEEPLQRFKRKIRLTEENSMDKNKTTFSKNISTEVSMLGKNNSRLNTDLTEKYRSGSKKNIRSKIYLTGTNQSSSYQNSSGNITKIEENNEKNKFVYAQVQKYLDLEEKKAMNELRDANKKQKRKIRELKGLKLSMNNPFASVLSDIFDCFKRERLPSLSPSNREYPFDFSENPNLTIKHRRIFSQDYQNVDRIKPKPKVKPELSLEDKKEIMIKFLENELVKKLIYEGLYQKINQYK